MKLAYVSNSAKGEYTGRIRWIRMLKRHNIKVTMIVPLNEEKYIKLIEKEDIKVITYLLDRKNVNLLRELATIYQLYRIFKKERFNIVHSFTPKPNIYATIAARLAKIPVIINHVTGLGSLFVEEYPSLPILVLGKLLKLLYRYAFLLSTKIIFQNEDDHNFFSFIPSDKKLIIKGSGIDIYEYSPVNIDVSKVKKLKQESGIKRNQCVITFIGRLVTCKGICEFVESAHILSKRYGNLVFLVVGDIDKDNIYSISKNFIVENQNIYLRFLGRRDDIREILYITDIFVNPSYYREGIPRTNLEAMAMEKPIITTNSPGCKETVENGKTGLLVMPKDILSLVKAIEKLIRNRNLRQEMGKHGREKVIKEFSTEIIVEQIKGLYNDLFIKAGIYKRCS